MNTRSTPSCPRGSRRAALAAMFVGLLAAAVLPATSLAQSNGDEGDDGSDGGYVTTTTAPERSLDVTAFSPECIRDAPHINYTIKPVGFTSTGPATLVIKDRTGRVVDTKVVPTLSGTFLFPGASVDANGNATDWPGWKRADDGSWIPDPSDAILREGLTIEVTVNPTATATVSYPPATSTCAGPDDEERSLDVTAFSPVCIADAPFIQYDIRPIGFTSSGPATLTFFDRNGTFVETRVVPTLSGRTVFPGASVDANGNATDWPGWKQADDGSWIPDPSDAILREGLTIEVTVNPTATASVGYPPATAACNGPGDEPCTPGDDNDGTPEDDCDPCRPGDDGDDNPADDCTPCYPGQNNDDDPTDDCILPRAGGGPGVLLYIGGAAVLAGLVFVVTARRRNDAGATPTPR